jgi:hypothetical protein
MIVTKLTLNAASSGITKPTNRSRLPYDPVHDIVV